MTLLLMSMYFDICIRDSVVAILVFLQQYVKFVYLLPIIALDYI